MGSTDHTSIMRWSAAALLVVSVGADQVKYPIIKAWTKHMAKSDSNTNLTREPRNAQQNGYGAPEKEEEVVDLHNKEFCVDVSTFQEVVWVDRDGEMCKTDFVKQCEQKSENVCADVTETRCQVVPYTECEMGEESQEFTETKFEPKLFVEKHCTTGQRTIPHQKFLTSNAVTSKSCGTMSQNQQQAQGEQTRSAAKRKVQQIVKPRLGLTARQYHGMSAERYLSQSVSLRVSTFQHRRDYTERNASCQMKNLCLLILRPLNQTIRDRDQHWDCPEFLLYIYFCLFIYLFGHSYNNKVQVMT